MEKGAYAPGLRGWAEGGPQGPSHSPWHAATALTKPAMDQEEGRQRVQEDSKGGERAGTREGRGLEKRYFHFIFSIHSKTYCEREVRVHSPRKCHSAERHVGEQGEPGPEGLT